MEKLPTASEHLNSKGLFYNQKSIDEANKYAEAMITFTKLHVQAALEAAAKTCIEATIYSQRIHRITTDVKILNAYPLENIK